MSDCDNNKRESAIVDNSSAQNTNDDDTTPSSTNNCEVTRVGQPCDSIDNTIGTTTTTSSSEYEERYSFDSPDKNDTPELDEEGRMAAYVDFDEYYGYVEEAKTKGLEVDPDLTATTVQ